MYKLKKDIELRKLQDFGYKYVGDYNRGDQWLKEINIIVDGKNLGGILIQEWIEINFRCRQTRNRFRRSLFRFSRMVKTCY